MAPRLTLSQARDLKDFLGNHQKVSLLQSWTNVKCRAEELKVSWKSFRQMRREKVTPKCLGNIRSKNDDDISPFTNKEDHALVNLIKDTDKIKVIAFAR